VDKNRLNYMKIIAVKGFQLRQLKRRNLEKFRLEREPNPCMNRTHVFHCDLHWLKSLHWDDLHIILVHLFLMIRTEVRFIRVRYGGP